MNYLAAIQNAMVSYTTQVVESVKKIPFEDVSKKVSQAYSSMKNGCFDFMNPQIEGERHRPDLGGEEERKEGEMVKNPRAAQARIPESNIDLLNPYPEEEQPGALPSNVVRRRKKVYELL